MPSLLLELAMAGDVVGASRALRKRAAGAEYPEIGGVPGSRILDTPSIIMPEGVGDAANAVKVESASGRGVGADALRQALPDIDVLTYTDQLDDGSKLETGLYDSRSAANFAALFGGAAARRSAFARHGAIIGKELLRRQKKTKYGLGRGRPDFGRGRPDF